MSAERSHRSAVTPAWTIRLLPAQVMVELRGPLWPASVRAAAHGLV